MTKPRTLAVIPARGGSKGIPRKNVRLLNGKPLISYMIETALRCGLIDKVVVSTDSSEINRIAESADCAVLMRPVHLATGDIPLDPVIYHAMTAIEEREGAKYDVIITLQPTSPLLFAHSIDKALQHFFCSNIDTLISVVPDQHLFWAKRDDEHFPLYEKRLNRQYLPMTYRETGGFVITHRKCITETSRFGVNIDLFAVSATEAIDIDDEMDWRLAEMYIE